MNKQESTNIGQAVRFVGAMIITVVVCVLAVMDQSSGGSVDGKIVGALLLIFGGWLGENILDLVNAVFGRNS